MDIKKVWRLYLLYLVFRSWRTYSLDKEQPHTADAIQTAPSGQDISNDAGAIANHLQAVSDRQV